jgi:hypothetical protein
MICELRNAELFFVPWQVLQPLRPLRDLLLADAGEFFGLLDQ